MDEIDESSLFIIDRWTTISRTDRYTTEGISGIRGGAVEAIEDIWTSIRDDESTFMREGSWEDPCHSDPTLYTWDSEVDLIERHRRFEQWWLTRWEKGEISEWITIDDRERDHTPTSYGDTIDIPIITDGMESREIGVIRHLYSHPDTSGRGFSVDLIDMVILSSDWLTTWEKKHERKKEKKTFHIRALWKKETKKQLIYKNQGYTGTCLFFYPRFVWRLYKSFGSLPWRAMS